ncbi:hypothetical protein ACHWQZ_G006060 [Mnemiopsis leidyi]
MGLLCLHDIGVIYLITLILQQVAGDGTVSLHIQSYNNPISKSLEGEVCAGQCVNTFTITLFTLVRVGQGETTLEEVKQIHSNDDIGDVESFSSTLGTQWSNPLLINFAGKVRLKFTLVVTGVEKNYPNNEYEMARFTYDQSDKFSDKVTLLSGSASLTFSYNANCGANYYGTCEEMCVPRTSSEGHYTCNSSTGEKICLEGWSGVNCDTAADDTDSQHIPIVTKNPVTDSSKDSSSTDEREEDSKTDANVDPDASKQESSSKRKLNIDMDTLWKVLAICGGVVIGTVIVVLWIWYRTRYRKKRSSMPKIVVSNEQFFEKTGNFIIEKLEPSAPGEETLAREQRGSVVASQKDNALTSFSISDLNKNSTPPPVEQPEHDEI